MRTLLTFPAWTALLVGFVACQSAPAPTALPEPTATATIVPTARPLPTATPELTATPVVLLMDSGKVEAGIAVMLECVNAHPTFREAMEAALTQDTSMDPELAEALAETMLDNEALFLAAMMEYVKQNPADAEIYELVADLAAEDVEAACAEFAAETGPPGT